MSPQPTREKGDHRAGTAGGGPLGRTGALCLAALLLVELIPTGLWIFRDARPWPWDQAWYGEVSTDLWFFFTHSPIGWLRTMVTAMYMKPPGIVWLGQLFVPLAHVCGSLESALLLSVLLTQAVTLYIVFQIGRSLAPRSAAVPFLGVAMVASAPSFVGLSHQFFVEPLQALAVAWTVLIMVRAADWPAPRIVLHLVAAQTVGLLAKATTPVYCLLPCVYLLVTLLRRPLFQGWREEQRSWPGRSLIAGLALLIPATAGWYAVNFKAVWQHMKEASSGEIALQYGFRASVGAKLVVWARLWNQSCLAPYLGWALIIAAVAGIAFWIFRPRESAIPDAKNVPLILCGLQGALLLLVFSMNDAVDARYMYPLLVFVAVILMSLCARIAFKPVFAVLFALCLLELVSVQRVALGAIPPSGEQFGWLTAPQPDPTCYREVEGIVAITSNIDGRYNIVGIEEPWLNANTVSFFAAKHRLDTRVRSYFTSLGYAQTDVVAAVKRVEDLHVLYYITLDEAHQTSPPNFVNVVSLPMLKEIAADSRYQRIPFSTVKGVLIFQPR